jgi:hypothetical protein
MFVPRRPFQPRLLFVIREGTLIGLNQVGLVSPELLEKNTLAYLVPLKITNNFLQHFLQRSFCFIAKVANLTRAFDLEMLSRLL